jgi:hypothetical protein
MLRWVLNRRAFGLVGLALVLLQAPGSAWANNDDGGRQAAPGINVRIDSDDSRVRLERVEEAWGHRDYSVVCAPPCGRWLTRDAAYRISGDRVRATSPFQLPDQGAQANLTVKAGSSGRFAAGVATMGVGAAAAIVGAVVLYASGYGALDLPPAQAEDRRATLDRNRKIGVGVMFGGAAMLAVGAFLVHGSRTEVSVETR